MVNYIRYDCIYKIIMPVNVSYFFCMYFSNWIHGNDVNWVREKSMLNYTFAENTVEVIGNYEKIMNIGVIEIWNWNKKNWMLPK